MRYDERKRVHTALLGVLHDVSRALNELDAKNDAAVYGPVARIKASGEWLTRTLGAAAAETEPPLVDSDRGAAPAVLASRAHESVQGAAAADPAVAFFDERFERRDASHEARRLGRQPTSGETDEELSRRRAAAEAERLEKERRLAVCDLCIALGRHPADEEVDAELRRRGWL